jgi:Resolvase, N terminal domain
MSHPALPNVATDGQERRPLARRRVPAVVCYLRTANPGGAGMRLLGRQRARLEAACVARGWTVVVWIEELHQSGTTMDRPGLRQALALLAGRQADALLACDHSRLAVDPRVGSELAVLADRQGWQLLTLDPNPPPTTVAMAVAVVDGHTAGLDLDHGGACR